MALLKSDYIRDRPELDAPHVQATVHNRMHCPANYNGLVIPLRTKSFHSDYSETLATMNGAFNSEQITSFPSPHSE